MYSPFCLAPTTAWARRQTKPMGNLLQVVSKLKLQTWPVKYILYKTSSESTKFCKTF